MKKSDRTASTEPQQNPPFSRRDFIKSAGSAAIGLMGGASLFGGVDLAAAAASAAHSSPGPSGDVTPPSQPGAKQPHIILIMADQLRADAVGVDGNPVARTPHIDALARDGAYFRSAYSEAPTCTPARAVLLTGLDPWNNGLLGYTDIAQHYAVTLPSEMARAGYYPVVVGKCHYHLQRNLHGFKVAWLDESDRVESADFVSDYHQWFALNYPGLDPDATGLGWNDYRAQAYALPEVAHPTRWTADTAIDFLDHYDFKQPLFLKVSFERPHSPYDPPRRCLEAFDPATIPSAKVGDWAKGFAPRSGSGFDIWHGDLGKAQMQGSRCGYYGSVAFVDEQVGRLVKKLKDAGLYEQSLIIFMADHGDMLGDHHHWRKGYAYEGAARIPLIVRWPDGVGRTARGAVIHNPVGIVDVLPTLLDFVKASAPAVPLDGRSLLDLLRGSADWRSHIALEHGMVYDPSVHWNALTDGRTKYIFHASSGTEQLFDLSQDPHEQVDLAPDKAYASSLVLWRQRLVEKLTPRGSHWVRHGKLQVRTSPDVRSPNYPVSPATQSSFS